MNSSQKTDSSTIKNSDAAINVRQNPFEDPVADVTPNKRFENSIFTGIKKTLHDFRVRYFPTKLETAFNQTKEIVAGHLDAFPKIAENIKSIDHDVTVMNEIILKHQENKLSNLKNKQEILQREINSLTGSIQDRETKNKPIEEKIQDLEIQQKKGREKLALHQTQHAQLKEKLNIVNKDLKNIVDHRSRIKGREYDFTNTTENLESLQENFDSQLKDVTAQIEINKNEYREISENLNDIESRLSDKKQQQLVLMDQITDHSNDKDFQQIQTINQEIGELTEQQETLKLRQETIFSSLTQVSNQQIDLQDKLNGVKAAISIRDLSKKIEKLSAEINDAQTNSEASQSTINDLERQIITEKSLLLPVEDMHTQQQALLEQQKTNEEGIAETNQKIHAIRQKTQELNVERLTLEKSMETEFSSILDVLSNSFETGLLEHLDKDLSKQLNKKNSLYYAEEGINTRYVQIKNYLIKSSNVYFSNFNKLIEKRLLEQAKELPDASSKEMIKNFLFTQASQRLCAKMENHFQKIANSSNSTNIDQQKANFWGALSKKFSEDLFQNDSVKEIEKLKTVTEVAFVPQSNEILNKNIVIANKIDAIFSRFESQNDQLRLKNKKTPNALTQGEQKTLAANRLLFQSIVEMTKQLDKTSEAIKLRVQDKRIKTALGLAEVLKKLPESEPDLVPQPLPSEILAQIQKDEDEENDFLKQIKNLFGFNTQ